MFQLALQLLRKSRDFPGFIMDHLRSDHNMSQKLSVIRIIIHGKRAEFFGLADIMKHGCCDQQVFIENGICTAVITAELHYTQSMLQKSTDKSMMHGFCSGIPLECPDKCLIFRKKAVQKTGKINILHPAYEIQKLAIHGLHAFITDRKIISGLVFSLRCLAGPLDAHLQRSLEAGHISHNIHVVQGIKIINPQRIRVPDLCVYRACLVL